MSSEEVKTENSSQEKTTEVKTYSDEQFKGLLADKQAEVKKRQEAEKQIADLQGQVETLTSRSSRANEETGEQGRPLLKGATIWGISLVGPAIGTLLYTKIGFF